MEGTQKATEEQRVPRGPRLPWISTIEPTVFWGCVLLVALCAVVVPLWGIWLEARATRHETVRLRQIEELRRTDDGDLQQRDGDAGPR